MTIFKNTKVTYEDSPYTISGDRLRTISPVSLFENRFEYDTQDVLWEIVSNTNGTLSHLPNKSGARLSIGTNSGDILVRQTRQYFVYTSGKPHSIRTGVLFGSPKSGVRRREGYFDENNGIFLEQTNSNISIVRRTSESGSVVNNGVTQQDWNIDKFDGAGPSGVTLDLSKIQMLVFDFSWYGAGTISVGFEVGNVVYYAHEFKAGNNLTSPIIGSPTLPLRYEIENTSGTASSSNLDIFGGSVSLDSSDVPTGFVFDASNGTNLVDAANGTRTPILSIAPKFTYKTFENRGNISPRFFDIISQDSLVYYEIIRNGNLTGATWSSVNANSITEFDVASTDISGGVVVQSGYIPTGQNNEGSVKSTVESSIPLTINHDASDRDILSVVCTGVGATSSCGAAINLKEIY